MDSHMLSASPWSPGSQPILFRRRTAKPIAVPIAYSLNSFDADILSIIFRFAFLFTFPAWSCLAVRAASKELNLAVDKYIEEHCGERSRQWWRALQLPIEPSMSESESEMIKVWGTNPAAAGWTGQSSNERTMGFALEVGDLNKCLGKTCGWFHSGVIDAFASWAVSTIEGARVETDTSSGAIEHLYLGSYHSQSLQAHGGEAHASMPAATEEYRNMVSRAANLHHIYNLSNKHWAYVHVSKANEVLRIYDGLSMVHNSHAIQILEFLAALTSDQSYQGYDIELHNPNLQGGAPYPFFSYVRQEDGHSCGPLALAAFFHSLKAARMTFQTSDMQAWREFIAVKIQEWLLELKQ